MARYKVTIYNKDYTKHISTFIHSFEKLTKKQIMIQGRLKVSNIFNTDYETLKVKYPYTEIQEED